ncbi:phosphomannomutase/phosphoglucomutase [Acetonema longum]|uniref:Phosphomannomutase n=1 Tax=Acetonema longum DSM 6540 TaxID=1009370 RepID=F7NNR8_9FIRM|nr:phosphomannomutase/phosphoglucomutase [Acetonema longum]EGO62252.1 phosphomannomutase [Acetonema longum DSM 6540]
MSEKISITRNIFKAYDIRGKIPGELNETVAYRIGRAYVDQFHTKQVVVGCDVRLSSLSLVKALSQGLRDGGCNVLNIGLCGTEQVYFATFHLKTDGGIMVTASHNPMDYNGMKMVLAESRPVSGDTGLRALEERVMAGNFVAADVPGVEREFQIMPDYVKHLLTYVNTSALKPLKVVVNAGNGNAGAVIDALEPHLPFQFVKVNHVPDGTFPNGIPNPLLPENREVTASEVRRTGADVGIAWDGDFDRCFLFDEKGGFIEGYYIVGFLGQAFLRKNPCAKIIHDPRLTWNTVEQVTELGGVPVLSKTGHAFIKERMRQEDAVYGGEMSAHHYFKSFAYCDSGMIPWILILECICQQNRPLSQLVGDRMKRFPVSGEINREVRDSAVVLQVIENHYANGAKRIDRTDGLSLEFDQWRFNVRMSNTEPLLRLNIEAKDNKALMEKKTEEILSLIASV